MKKLYGLLAAILVAGSLNAQKLAADTSKLQNADTRKTEADTMVMRQIDGTVIHVVGTGSLFITYLETTDGYTIVRDRVGIFEYARANDKGDLVASGIKANDPSQRSAKETRQLKKMPRHLRYSGEKLKKLQDKEEHFFDRPKNKKEQEQEDKKEEK